jgi:hypothetical protein
VPAADLCRDHGEQALLELTQSGAGVVRVAVAFGSIRPDGCRAVDYTITYATPAEDSLSTQVCAGAASD